MANPLFIERTFSHIRQHEVVVIGPFETRKIANAYKKRTDRNAKPRTMYDYMYESRVTTKPKKADFTMQPDEYMLFEIEDQIANKTK